MKKQRFIGLLSTLCAVCLAFGVTFSITNTTASADAVAVTGTAASVDGKVELESFTMLTGASVKKTGEHQGMRFTSQISEDDLAKLPNNAQFGTLVLPAHMLAAGQLTKATADVLDIKAAVWKETSESGMKTFTGVLVDYPEEFYATEMLARSYVTYTDENGTEYTVYAKNAQTRDLAYIVSAALNKGETGDLLTDVMDSVAPTFAFASSSVSISLGTTYELEFAKGQGEGLDVSYQSDNEDIALVDDCGIVWGRSAGTTKITATMNGKTAMVDVTVQEGDAVVVPVWNNLSSTAAIKTTLNRWSHTIPAIPTTSEITAIGGSASASYLRVDGIAGQFSYAGYKILPANDKATYEAYSDYNVVFDWYYDIPSNDSVLHNVMTYGETSNKQYAQDTWHTVTIPVSSLLAEWDNLIDNSDPMTKGTAWLDFNWTSGSGDPAGVLYIGNIRIEEPVKESPVWNNLSSTDAIKTTANRWSHTIPAIPTTSEITAIGGSASASYLRVDGIAGQFSYAGYKILPANDKATYEVYADATLKFDWYYDIPSNDSVQHNVMTYGETSNTRYEQDTWHTVTIPMSSLLAEWDNLIDSSNPMSKGTAWLDFNWTSGSGDPAGVLYIGNIRIEAASGSGSGESTLPDSVDATVWTANGTEKFLQNQSYTDRYTNTVLTYNVFKNETESAQILITPAQNISWYGVITSSLTNANGELLSLKNFEVFHQKYMEITEVKSTEATTVANGIYPDALIPISAAAKYGETAIVSGNNQGVWITVNVPADQEAGVYTGEFIVFLDGVAFPIEVLVNVYDYAVSDEIYTASRFGLGWDNVEYAEGLYGGSVSTAVQRAYYEYMLDMGISLSSLPGVSDFYFHYNGTYDPNADVFADNFVFNYGGADYNGDGKNEYYKNVDNGKMETYVQEVANYTLDNRCTMIPLAVRSYEGVYYELDTGDSDGDGNTTEYLPVTKYTVKYTYEGTEYAVSSVDQVQLLRTVKELYKYSLANGVNMFEKLALVLSWIDEFSGNLTEIASAEYNFKLLSDWFERCKTYLVAHESEYVLGNGVSESFRVQVLNSLAGIKVITPTADPTANMTTEDTPFVLCPTIDSYHLQSNRDEIKAWVEGSYGVGSSLWTYTCVNPSYPNPTYHLGDNLISSRLLNWMMYEYGITGNLYWSTMYVKNGAVDVDTKIDDMYAYPLRSGEVNGDGYLLYPGSAYGVKGPIGSIRLQSIRDGVEEYNLLYALEGYAKARSAAKGETYSVDNFRSVLHMLTEALYSGTQIKYEDGYLANFANSREMLAELLVLAKNGIVVENSVVSGDAVTVTISAPESVEFTVNGSVVSETVNGFVTYIVTLSVAEDGALNITTGSGEVEEEEELPAMVWNDMSQASALTTTVNPWTASQATRNGLVSESKVAELGGVSGAAYTSVTLGTGFLCYGGYQIVPSNTDKTVWEAYSEYDIVFDWYYDVTGDTNNEYNYLVKVYGAAEVEFLQDMWHTSRVPMADILADWADVIAGSNNKGDSSPWTPWIKFKQTSANHEAQAGIVYIGNIRIQKPVKEEADENIMDVEWNDMSQASALTTTVNPWSSSQATRNGLVSESKVAELGGVSGAAYTSVTAMSNWFCYAGYQIVPSNTDKTAWEKYADCNIVFDWYYDITGDTSNTYHYQVSVYGAENAEFAQDMWHTSSVPMADILADWSDVSNGSNNGGDNSPWKPWIKFKWTSSSHASQAGTVYIGNIRIVAPAKELGKEMPNVNLSIPLTAETTIDSSWLSSATAKYQKRAWSTNLSSGSISTKTLSASNSVGGKTSGSYYYFEATTSSLGNIRAFSLQPSSSSVLENAGDIELQFDVYFEIEGKHSSEMKNCFLTGQVGNKGVQEGVWHTFSVKLSTILEYWDTYSKPAGSGAPYEIALFAINLSYGNDTNNVNCYIGNFKLVEP